MCPSCAGVYLPASELAFDGSVWGSAEEYGDARLERCRAFMPVTGASVEAWLSTALDIEEVLSGTGGDISCTSWSLMLSSLLTRWIGPLWIALWVGWVCLIGFEGLIFHFIVRFASG